MRKSTKLFTSLSIFGALLFTSSVNAQHVYRGADASKKIPGADIVRDGSFSNNPSYIHFAAGKEIELKDWKNWIGSTMKFNFQTNFNLLKSEKDKLGFTHYRFQQVLNGYAVENGIWLVHTKGSKVVSMNGLLYSSIPAPASPALTESAALAKALAFVHATKYKWEMPEEEKFIKESSHDASATYYPKGQLVYACKNNKYFEANNHLTYKFNIYAHAPIYRAEVYVDAITGEIVLEDKVLMDADVVGTAVTAYSGTQPITTDSFGGSFRLREAGRGNGINTYNMLTGTSYGAAVDFTDADNTWNNVNAAQDEVATDAHFGAEMTYDYYMTNHGRNSIDGAGFALNSYVHYDVDYNNAFWDGTQMTYGDGDGSPFNPFTALDIAGHEITHGLTTFTANLDYADESGALNESFSDIFGASIEFWATPAVSDWLMGEDIGFVIRNMGNPNAAGDPDTYFGTNWAPLGGADNGGVHTNSNVQNYWYYLLSTGGSGTNDNGDVYNVSPIGLTNAGEIAFRNLTVYLTNTSQFADSRFYSIVAATDLFGGCSPEVESTTNAWYAVGVGPAYVAEVTAAYVPDNTGGCAVPLTVNFTNTSTNGINYTWDFGDGGTSTLDNPSHTYTVNGIYTVTLIADGGLCGIDTTVVTNQIFVGQLPDPVVVNGGRCDPGTVNLSASSTGTINWFNVPTGGASIATGNTYTTPSLSSTTTYYVEASTGGTAYVGPVDNSIGASGTSTGNRYLIFDALQPFTLVSVWVNATVSGNRTIELRNSGGTVLQSATINIPAGASTITLNFNVPVGTNLQLGVNAASVPSNLQRNTSGVAFPYTLPGVVSITNSSVGTGSYYWFYNWEVLLTPCTSDRVPVTAQIATGPTVTNATRCGAGTVSLSASSPSGTLNWYDAPTAGVLVNTGSTYNVSLSSTTTFYVEEQMPAISAFAGPSNNTFGTGGYFTGDQHLIFDVLGTSVLHSVKVYANGSGNRTVQLRNSAGTVINSLTAFVPNGESRIILDFPLTPGTNYQLGWPVGSSPNLYRNNASAVYPYTLAGLVSITGTSATVAGYYYAYYDWEVQTPGCITARVPVTGTINTSADATITSTAPFCSSDPATNLTAVDAGGTWSGTGITNTSLGTFDPTSVGPGTYPITYTITGTCGDVGTANIVVTNLFDATISSPGTICTGSSPVNLTAADPSGTWSGTGITNASLGTFDASSLSAGTYTVTYTISGTCGATDTEVITVVTSQNATITTAGPFCEGDAPVSLTAVDAGGTWTGSGVFGTTFDPSISGTGSFTITYTIPGTCGSVDTATFVVNPLPNANINIPIGPICDDMISVTLTAAQSGGVWSADCGSCINFVNGKFNPSAAGAGNWNVVYTVTGPCGTDVDTLPITVQICSGIVEANDQFGIQILPNPANEMVQLNILNAPAGNAKISIKNSIGQLVWSSTETITGKPIFVNVSNFNSGVYFVNTLVGNQNATSKLVIK